MVDKVAFENALHQWLASWKQQGLADVEMMHALVSKAQEAAPDNVTVSTTDTNTGAPVTVPASTTQSSTAQTPVTSPAVTTTTPAAPNPTASQS